MTWHEVNLNVELEKKYLLLGKSSVSVGFRAKECVPGSLTFTYDENNFINIDGGEPSLVLMQML